MSTEQVKPEPGQIWADNDIRSKGRMIRIESVWTSTGGEEYATAIVVANDDMVQAALDKAAKEGYRSHHLDRRGKKTTIKARRLRPTTTGYRLVQDV